MDVSHVTSIVPVGAALHHSFPEELRERFPNAENIVNAYGLTEVSGVAVSKGDFTKVGALVRGAVAKVVDIDTGELLGPNQVGTMMLTSI